MDKLYQLRLQIFEFLKDYTKDNPLASAKDLLENDYIMEKILKDDLTE